ncbi:MAG: hypothetical protein LBV41_09530 [Cytophagaceae bacterium]|nr:hypothetical protein [Cytophagaceae bacterium]
MFADHNAMFAEHNAMFAEHNAMFAEYNAMFANNNVKFVNHYAKFANHNTKIGKHYAVFANYISYYAVLPVLAFKSLNLPHRRRANYCLRYASFLASNEASINVALRSMFFKSSDSLKQTLILLILAAVTSASMPTQRCLP